MKRPTGMSRFSLGLSPHENIDLLKILKIPILFIQQKLEGSIMSAAKQRLGSFQHYLILHLHEIQEIL